MSRQNPQFHVRLPEALLTQIKKAAEKERRSVTAEIIRRLEESFSRKN